MPSREFVFPRLRYLFPSGLGDTFLFVGFFGLDFDLGAVRGFSGAVFVGAQDFLDAFRRILAFHTC